MANVKIETVKEEVVQIVEKRVYLLELTEAEVAALATLTGRVRGAVKTDNDDKINQVTSRIYQALGQVMPSNHELRKKYFHQLKPVVIDVRD